MARTVAVEIPISGIRSLRETLDLTRRGDRATAYAIKNSDTDSLGKLSCLSLYATS